MALSNEPHRAFARVRTVGPDDPPAAGAPLRLAAGWATAGLYLPSFEPAHHEHELTRKIRRSKVSREHNTEFAEMLAGVAGRCFSGFKPELIASVPPRPGQEDRFRNIRSDVARRTGAIDAGPLLRQTRIVEGYRRMTIPQRRAASLGRFATNASLRQKSVLLIDDVVTSGAQASDAIRALIEAGAADVRLVALASAICPLRMRERRQAAPCGSRQTNPLREESHTMHSMAARVVLEVISVEPLPPGASGSRRAIVRWSDGSADEALRWWDDEILFCEGDIIGKTEAELRNLHFRRDRDYLRSRPP